MKLTQLELAGLDTAIVSPDDAALTCVLFHGFGASGEDLVSLAQVFGGPIRYVFPAGPIELGGLYGDSRAWWMIDIARLEADRVRGVARERRKEVPNGLVEARQLAMGLVDELAAKYPGPIVLGGFSQGAMLSLDVALHRSVAPAGLILMSGTLIAETEWQPRMASLAGVPVMQSHGREDAILPFDAAETLRDLLIVAGAKVDWQPFRGGHEIPQRVAMAAAELLHARAAT